jgi:hypothetical protein
LIRDDHRHEISRGLTRKLGCVRRATPPRIEILSCALHLNQLDTVRPRNFDLDTGRIAIFKVQLL